MKREVSTDDSHTNVGDLPRAHKPLPHIMFWDRLTQQVLGTAARPAAMPMDAWRENAEFLVEFDLPGMTPIRWIWMSNATW